MHRIRLSKLRRLCLKSPACAGGEALIHCLRVVGARAMMGERQTDQTELFYGFSLGRHVPADHVLRSIDRFVDLGDIREQPRPYYIATGRPPMHPAPLTPMIPIAYCRGIPTRHRRSDEVNH